MKLTPEEIELNLEVYNKDKYSIIRNSPFYGYILAHLIVEIIPPTESIPIAAVNEKNLFLTGLTNNNYIAYKDRPISQRELILKHEINHIILKHLEYSSSVDLQLANIAMDAVNHRILADDPTVSLSSLPKGCVIPDPQDRGFKVGLEETFVSISDFRSKDWIEIYFDLLDRQQSNFTKYKLNNSYGNDIDPSGITDEKAYSDLKQVVLEAAAQSEAHGKLPAGLQRYISNLTVSKINWIEKLNECLNLHLASEDFSWKVNKRYRYLKYSPPKIESWAVKNIWYVIDTSSSMTKSAVTQALSELKAMRQVRKFNFFLLCCDSKAYKVQEFDSNTPSWDDIIIEGGGGTSFIPAFEKVDEWIVASSEEPALLVYFTDAMGSFPKIPPFYPVIFVIPGSCKAPFGESINISEH